MSISIGRPLANVQTYILDKFLNPVPVGVVGELCIAGDCVGAGYLNRSELTAEKFVDNPFGAGKLYRTGDLAYWQEDGNIFYVGRNDYQVKIRGLRIELAEIERAICEVSNVAQAVVVVRKDENNRQLICAFYTETAHSDLKQIKKNISEKLPQYMMPHIFTLLSEMPLTPSGKINRSALPNVNVNGTENDTPYEQPVRTMEKKLAKLMEQVLNYEPIGLYEDFFDYGGDSLKAIELVAKAHNEGLYFDLQSVFDYRTVSGLCDSIRAANKKSCKYTDKEFNQYSSILAKNDLTRFTVPSRHELGNVLITGVTGFLGMHILSEYLRTTSGKAYCLIRGTSKDDCAVRLNKLFNYYFGDSCIGNERVEIVCGDITKPIICDADIDMVFHAAASVKHYGSYEYFHSVNVEGTKNIIAFAKEKRARLLHISTLSISGNSFDNFEPSINNNRYFSEKNIFIGQNLNNVYARSKFEAERAVFDSMLDGLEANICRMGNISNRRSDSKFQINYQSNATLKRLKAMIELGLIPDNLKEIKLDFSPVDDSAKAIISIAKCFNDEYTVFHINNCNEVSLENFVAILGNLGIDIATVPEKEFFDSLHESSKDENKEYLLESFINDMDESEHLNYQSNIIIDSKFSNGYLNAIGFKWSEIDYDYIKKWLGYFVKIGYINV